MSDLPTGTVTFLFTDIEGSTRLWADHPEVMGGAVVRHEELIREAVETHGGYVFSTAGDSFAAAFSTADEAIDAAVQAQLTVASEGWGETPIRVRMGIHSGEAQERDGDYFGEQRRGLCWRRCDTCRDDNRWFECAWNTVAVEP